MVVWDAKAPPVESRVLKGTPKRSCLEDVGFHLVAQKALNGFDGSEIW